MADREVSSGSSDNCPVIRIRGRSGTGNRRKLRCTPLTTSDATTGSSGRFRRTGATCSCAEPGGLRFSFGTSRNENSVQDSAPRIIPHHLHMTFNVSPPGSFVSALSHALSNCSGLNSWCCRAGRPRSGWRGQVGAAYLFPCRRVASLRRPFGSLGPRARDRSGRPDEVGDQEMVVHSRRR